MSAEQEKPSFREYAKTYQETQQRDKVGLLGEIMTTLGSGSLGYGSATTIASWFGGNIVTYTAPISAKVLSLLPAAMVKWLGITAITTVTTPVGWVIGSTIACAAIGFGVARWLRSGGINDERRKTLGKSILEKMEKIFHAKKQAQQTGATINDADFMPQVEEALRELGQAGVITPERVEGYLEKLRTGKIPLNVILNILKEHGRELVNPSINPNADIDAELNKAASARAFTAMNKGVTNAEEPSELFLDTMQARFGVERGRALELYRDAPIDPNPKATAEQLGQVFCDEVIKSAYEALAETAHGMQQGQAAYLRFLEVQDIMNRQFAMQTDIIDKAGLEAMAAINRL